MDAGANVFTVEVDDGNGGTNTATLNITVDAVNDAPVFTVDPINEANATEDIAYTGSVANATDAEDDTLTYSKVSGAAWATLNITVIATVRIVGGVTVLANDILKLEVSGASPAAYYYPASTTNLVDGPWERIPHSDDPGNPFIETNLSYATNVGDTNNIIYVQGDNTEEFFKIEIAE
jgi:hypothetical protein